MSVVLQFQRRDGFLWGAEQAVGRRTVVDMGKGILAFEELSARAVPSYYIVITSS